jgi:hypothetical protein
MCPSPFDAQQRATQLTSGIVDRCWCDATSPELGALSCQPVLGVDAWILSTSVRSSDTRLLPLIFFPTQADPAS